MICACGVGLSQSIARIALVRSASLNIPTCTFWMFPILFMKNVVGRPLTRYCFAVSSDIPFGYLRAYFFTNPFASPVGLLTAIPTNFTPLLAYILAALAN